MIDQALITYSSEIKSLAFETALAQAIGSEKITSDLLAGDGSDRQYYRIKSLDGDNHQSHILMLLNSPLDKQSLNLDQYNWIALSKFLGGLGLATPNVRAILKKQGAIIIEDFGDSTLDLALARGFAPEPIFSSVFTVLKTLSKSSASPNLLKAPFDAATFAYELNFFKDKFLLNHLGFNFDNRQKRLFTKECLDLGQYLAELPMCFVHRDFHSRNLMLLANGQVGVLDFQDARRGPIAYDLVSFCFDSYLHFDLQKRQEILGRGLLELKTVLTPNIYARVLESWPAVLLQRQLKALGSFAFLENEKKRGNYLRFVPEALKTLGLAQSKRWPFLSQDLIFEMNRCCLS